MIDNLIIHVYKMYKDKSEYDYYYKYNNYGKQMTLFSSKEFVVLDRVVVIDHTNSSIQWDIGTIVNYEDSENITVLLDSKKIKVSVNDRQIIHSEDFKEMSQILGVNDEDFTTFDNTPPPIPKDSVEKCICDMHQVMWGGCNCEFGKQELKKEVIYEG